MEEARVLKTQEIKFMMCLYREGKRRCTWWITGCVNPCVPAEVKNACNGQIARYKTQDTGRKFVRG